MMRSILGLSALVFLGGGALSQQKAMLEARAHGDRTIVALSPKGKWFATTANPDSLQIWNVPNKEVHYTLAFEWAPSMIAFTDEDTLIALAGIKTGGLEVCRIAVKAKTRERSTAVEGLPLAMTEDARFLVTTPPEPKRGLIRFYDLKAEKHSEIEGHSDFVRRGAISPDGKYVATMSYDHVLKMWRRADGKMLWERKFKGDQAQLLISSDNKRLIAVGWGHGLPTFLGVENGKEENTTIYPKGGARLVPDGSMLVGAFHRSFGKTKEDFEQEKKWLEFWSIEKDKKIYTMSLKRWGDEWRPSGNMCFSKDCSAVAVLGYGPGQNESSTRVYAIPKFER
jgi:WD40 repeat protein